VQIQHPSTLPPPSHPTPTHPTFPVQDPFLLSFRDEDLESRYQTYHAKRQRGTDLRCSLLCTITYAALVCKALEVHPGWSNTTWCWAGKRCGKAFWGLTMVG